MIFLILFFFISATPFNAHTMHIKKQEPIPKGLIQQALAIIKKKHPNHVLFNKTDMKHLGFLSSTIAQTINYPHPEELQQACQSLYLAQLNHKQSVNNPSFEPRTFLIDNHQGYILRLKEYPTTQKEKLEAVLSYIIKTKPYLSRSLQRIPLPLQNTFRAAMEKISQINGCTLLNVIHLDQTKHNGPYLILFRLKNLETTAISHVVYELKSGKCFPWDKNFYTLKSYYEHYQHIFKHDVERIT